jgi:endonuclease/exonuclease/phosphatase (EEP) superfamily protein YafD
VAIGILLTCIALIATFCMLLAPRFWVVDLLVHFRLQCTALALLACVVCAATGHLRWAIVALLAAMIHALIAAPLLASRRASPSMRLGQRAVIRVAAINVYYRNRKFQAAIDFIGRERPDAVVLCEVTAAWEQALAALNASYPYRYATRGKRGTGITLLSRWPLDTAVIVPGYSDVEPAIAATLQIEGRVVQILGVHTSWPLGPAASACRNQQLARIAEFARGATQPLIVLGDLNVSPFSREFQALLAAGDLKTAADGFGWQPTWPTFLPPGGIQIDHALTSAGVLVTGFRRGPSVGSDHLPIIIECAV